jgi:hypothetical protein
MDFWGAVISGAVGGIVSGGIAGFGVATHRLQSTTKGDHSPSAQTTHGAAQAVGGNVGGHLVGRDLIQQGQQAKAQLMAYVDDGRLIVTNTGDLDVHGATWWVDGERTSLRVMDSQTPKLPAIVAPHHTQQVAIVIMTMTPDTGAVTFVLEWPDERGERRQFTLPL